MSRPALLGGPPLRPQGPPDWPLPDAAVETALLAACRDGSWGKYAGGHVERLEERLAWMHGVRHALTCSSGTFAVELALRALRVGPGDEVVLSAYDYPGNFLSVHAVGASPVLADPDPDNACLTPEGAAGALGPRVKAILASHLHGGLAPMRELAELARERGVSLIEDAAQCPGAVVEGRPAGSWGDVGVFSFGGSKLLTAGRGGAVLTRHADVYQRARLAQHRGNVVCPLSELQAAALLPQLDRLPERHARRLRSVAFLAEGLAGLPGLRLFGNRVAESEPGYYKVGFWYDAAAFGLARARLVAAVRAEGIALDEGFRALHRGRAPSRFRAAGPLPHAERAHEDVVILHHPVLLGTDADIEQVAEALRRIHEHAPELARLT